jgi:hypothetical protein
MRVSDMALVSVESGWRPNILMPSRSAQRERADTLPRSRYRAGYRIEYGIVASGRPPGRVSRTGRAPAPMVFS